MLLQIVVILFLIFCNALLAMSELAVVSSRRSRLQALIKRRHRGARFAMRLLENPTDFLSTVQVGITFVGMFAAAYSGATLAEEIGGWLDRWAWISPYGQPAAIAVVTLGVTYVSVVFGELLPKRIALNDPERIASALAPFMRGVARVLAPAVWVARSSADGFLRLFGLARDRKLTVTEDEVRSLVAEGTRAGVFMPKEREMIEGVLRLADRTARAIMTPRTEVAWLEVNATPADIVAQLDARRLSRYPVCRETIDNPVGTVHMKNIARASPGEAMAASAPRAKPLATERIPA